MKGLKKLTTMPKGIFKPLTKSDEEKIRNEYLIKPIKTLASELGITGGRVQRMLTKMDLVIPKEIIEQRKKDSRFNRGHKPFNKGLRQSEYMSDESISRTQETRFKKGNEPHNTKSDGVVSIRKDTKTGICYKYIRVEKGEWELLSRYNYKRFIGELSECDVVTFKNGDQLNCSPQNLELITREEHLNRNFHNLPPELKRAIKNKNKILKLIGNGK